MIEGVRVKDIGFYADDRGFLCEILRSDENFIDKFCQITMSITFPGVIKAFHYHKKQDDCWFFPSGNVQVVLYDLRENSKTYKKIQVIYTGEKCLKVILIPHGVAHGYRVLGNNPATIIYVTNECYNKEEPDEYRIPYDDKAIGFDWNTHFR